MYRNTPFKTAKRTINKPYFNKIKLEFLLDSLLSFSISSFNAFLTNSAGYIAKILVMNINTNPRKRMFLYFHR